MLKKIHKIPQTTFLKEQDQKKKRRQAGPLLKVIEQGEPMYFYTAVRKGIM